jgi:hypothetical protein
MLPLLGIQKEENLKKKELTRFKFIILNEFGKVALATLCDISYCRYQASSSTEKGNQLFAETGVPVDGKLWSTNSMEKLNKRAKEIWTKQLADHPTDKEAEAARKAYLNLQTRSTSSATVATTSVLLESPQKERPTINAELRKFILLKCIFSFQFFMQLL